MILILPKGIQPRTSQDLHHSVMMLSANRIEVAARCRASPKHSTEAAAIMIWMRNRDSFRFTWEKPVEEDFEPDSISMAKEQAAGMLLELSVLDSDYAIEATNTSRPIGPTARPLPFQKYAPEYESHTSPFIGLHDGLSSTEALGSPIHFKSSPKRQIQRQGAAVKSFRSDRNIDYRRCQIMSLVMRDSMHLGKKCELSEAAKCTGDIKDL